MKRSSAEDPLYIAEGEGEGAREQRGDATARGCAVGSLAEPPPVRGHELLHAAEDLGADGGCLPALGGGGGPRVVDVAAGSDPGGDEDDLVELVEEEDGVQERDNVVEELGEGEGGGGVLR